jgi:hypothetical protein
MQQQQGDWTYIYYRLVARRWQSRRLAAELDPLKPPTGRVEPPTRHIEPQPGSTGSLVARAAQLTVLVSCGLFGISVALLTHYVNNNGGESLLKATSSDPASPLHPGDFKILVVLAALAFVITIISMLASRPSLMFGAAIAALGLIGYTVHIPSEGTFPGFGPYGSSYWFSLAVAIAMALTAGVAAVARRATR